MYVDPHEQITIRDAEKDKVTQHNRKTKQHNTTRPKQSFFKKNWLLCVGFDH